MKQGVWIFILLVSFTLGSSAQDLPAYRIYSGSGDRVKYKQMVRELKKADFVFFGELHNNTIAHWLQLELTGDLYEATNGSLVLGAEMFESDNQLILNEYLNDLISESRFESECRLWPNYQTDYKPLVLFSKEHAIPFIATNVPRRYASRVASTGLEGLDSLMQEAFQFLPPLPIQYDPELPCYKNMLSMGGMGGHGNSNLPKAQAIKDATMAHFSYRNWASGQLFLHFNGAYHSDNHEGIVWYLRKLNPDLTIMTISTVTQENVKRLDESSYYKANYILVVPENMTTTY